MRMIEVTESYGKMSAKLKETLTTMKPKENSDQRKARLRREARIAKAATKSSSSNARRKKMPSSSTATTKSAKPQTPKRNLKPRKASGSRSQTRRAGKPVSRT